MQITAQHAATTIVWHTQESPDSRDTWVSILPAHLARDGGLAKGCRCQNRVFKLHATARANGSTCHMLVKGGGGSARRNKQLQFVNGCTHDLDSPVHCAGMRHQKPCCGIVAVAQRQALLLLGARSMMAMHDNVSGTACDGVPSIQSSLIPVAVGVCQVQPVQQGALGSSNGEGFK